MPRFVHRVASLLFNAKLIPGMVQGVSRAHPDVTMRLETLVLYFHPPPGWDRDTEVDVEVAFRGGWLTEYYPDADADAPGILTSNPRSAEAKFGPLRESGRAARRHTPVYGRRRPVRRRGDGDAPHLGSVSIGSNA